MAFQEEKPEIKQKIEEVEVEVDLEGELIAALEELKIERRKHQKTFHKLDDANEIIVSLKIQVE